jgi:hypothetical protein
MGKILASLPLTILSGVILAVIMLIVVDLIAG